MARTFLVALTLFAVLFVNAARSSAQAAPQGTPYALPVSGPPRFSAEDVDWLSRNRAFATTGKILTVVGIVTSFVLASTVDEPAWFAGTGVQVLGQLMWTGADLAATNGLNRLGFYIPRGAPITAVVGAVLFSPVAWIAGPIASARIREARHSVGALSLLDSPVTSYGAGLRVSF